MAHVPAYGISSGIVSDLSEQLAPPPEPGILEVPEFLLQPLAKVKSAIDKGMRHVARGASLVELLAAYRLVDIAEQPQAVFRLWYSGKRPGQKVGFPIETAGMSEAFWHHKYDRARQLAIRDESLLSYLASSAWGTLVLNSLQSSWCNDARDGQYRLHPDHMATVLEATLRHWDAYVRLGRRFSSLGGGIQTFPCADTDAASLMGGCGVFVDHLEPVDEATLRANPHIKPSNLMNRGAIHLPEICRRERVIERLRSDDDFRRRVATMDMEKEADADRERAFAHARESARTQRG